MVHLVSRNWCRSSMFYARSVLHSMPCMLNRRNDFYVPHVMRDGWKVVPKPTPRATAKNPIRERASKASPMAPRAPCMVHDGSSTTCESNPQGQLWNL